MILFQKIKRENEKYTWAYLLKYTFYATLLSLMLLLLYGMCTVLITNTPMSTTSVFSTLKENFYFQYFDHPFLPHIIFYIFFEEFAFRKSLHAIPRNIILTLPLLLFLGGKSFIDESIYIYIYGLYALFLIIIFKRDATSKIVQRIHIILSLIVLSVFHISKFAFKEITAAEGLLNYVIPIIIIGGILAHLRLKFGSYASVISYFIIILFAHHL